MNDGFNPEMMVLARMLNDMKQSDLANVMGKTQAYVSKVECRATTPSEDFVQELSDKLKFPRSFFLQPGELAGVPASVHLFFRKTSKAKVLDRLNAEISLRILHLRIIQDRLRPHMDKFAEMLEVVRPKANEPIEAAKNLRKYCGIPNGPIEELAPIVEELGIFIFPCDFGEETNETVDGVSMNVPHLPPTIFLNKNRTADRLRFSLAHELFHIMAHRVPSDTMEKEANVFAGEFLMPEKDMRADLEPPISLNMLAALKPKWKASIASLLYRAGELEIVTQNQKNHLWRQINRMGWKKREPAFLDLEAEKIELVQDVFLSNDKEDLSELLHIQHGRMEEMYRTDCYDLK